MPDEAISTFPFLHPRFPVGCVENSVFPLETSTNDLYRHPARHLYQLGGPWRKRCSACSLLASHKPSTHQVGPVSAHSCIFSPTCDGSRSPVLPSTAYRRVWRVPGSHRCRLSSAVDRLGSLLRAHRLDSSSAARAHRTSGCGASTSCAARYPAPTGGCEAAGWVSVGSTF
jgi:hypothetical protein